MEPVKKICPAPRARIPGAILGESVAAAYASMSRPLGPAARLLAPHAHAMTDVTGFGLAGHLLEMLDASSASAIIRLDAIPLMPGALQLDRALDNAGKRHPCTQFVKPLGG